MEDQIQGYKGNALIKRANQQIGWTEDMVNEYLRCSQDPIYFTETYMKIISINDGLVNFRSEEHTSELQSH